MKDDWICSQCGKWHSDHARRLALWMWEDILTMAWFYRLGMHDTHQLSFNMENIPSPY